MTQAEALKQLRSLLDALEVALARAGAPRSIIANVRDVEGSIQWLEQNSKQR